MWDLFDHRVCRECGCTTAVACIDEDGQPCSWVAHNLCSGCVTP